MIVSGRFSARLLLAAGALLVAAACSHQESPTDSPVPARPALEQASVIRVDSGPLRGVLQERLRIFKGIPYAAAPIGEARWRPPGPVVPWTEVRDATAFGPACAQQSIVIPSIYSQDLGETSEDCLSLNVWAPLDAKDAAVFVWIHGGALAKGSSKEAFYNGARLAARGIIVVSINYRLGVLGWMAHPELSAESGQGVSGNYGLLDQIAALRWVRANIAAFGGDPAQVTIAGESAGGLSVVYLLAAPQARGLFARAIAQSAYLISTPELKQARNGEFAAEDIGRFVALKLQARDLAALRAMPAQALSDAAAAALYAPSGTVDGHVLPSQLVDTFDRREQAPVPLLAGFTSGEMRSLTFLTPPAPATPIEYEAIVRERYLDLAEAFLQRYPGSAMQESIYASSRDALYGWTAERLVRQQAALGKPAYLYYFDHGYPAAEAANLHGFHAAEIPYVFDTHPHTPPLWPKVEANPVENALTEAMQDYWSSFARSGQPRAAQAPDWPVYGSEQSYMAFQARPVVATALLPGMYDLHEEAVRRRRATGIQPWNWNVGVISPVLQPVRR